MKKTTRYSRKIVRTGLFFVLPVFVYFALLFWYPLFNAFTMSFQEILPRMQMQFVGLKIYREVLSDPIFWRSFVNTLLFTFQSVSITVFLALVIAIGIHNLKSIRLQNVLTLMYIVPTLVSFAAAGTIWEWILHPRFGLANEFLSIFGFSHLFQFLTSESQVIPSLAIMNIWVRMGFSVLILLSGLQSIPESYFEAAIVDGAKGMKVYRYITLPLLLPQIAVVTLLEIISSMKIFDIVYITTQGGPNGASNVLILYLYNNAFRYYRTDKASVVAVIIFVFLLAFGTIQRKVTDLGKYEY